MQVLSKEQQTYLEVHADEILKDKGISKATFTAAMGVKAQNFNKLVGTKNIVTLTQIGSYLNIPLQVLIYGKEEKEKEILGCIFVDGTSHTVRSVEELETLINTIKDDSKNRSDKKG